MNPDVVYKPVLFCVSNLLRTLLVMAGVLYATRTTAQTPLQLPFFDDFTTTTARTDTDRPDPAHWQPGSGVYINNTMAINQPTINVATFDGLQANGRPYVRDNALEQGYTDTLESRPISLAGLLATDGVYLSFYWQIKGLGELPDPGDTLSAAPGRPPVLQPGDSLTLQFRTAAGSWRTVWAITGSPPDNLFHQVLIQVVDPGYFNGNFAFRFRSFGRRSGPFDTWNLDYVYLNKGRSATDKFIKDLATRKALSPLLKRFTAMPMSQYRVRGAAELADSVTTDITNLFNNFNQTTARFSIYDETAGNRLIQTDTLLTLVAASGVRKVVFRPAPITPVATKATLRYEVALRTSDNENPIFQRDPRTLLRNDTISAVAALDDYFAYDDGSWEYAQQIRQREQIAVRFILNKPDTIGSVRACIVPFTKDQTGQSFVIKIYADLNGKPGPTLYQQSFQTQYPATRNGFVDFKLARNIIVKDTFYVGYQQISSSDTTFLRLGFDKNSPFGEHIFYNGGASWEQNVQKPASGTVLSGLQVPGAFMLRPVMGAKQAIVTAVTEPEPLPVLQAYPNPTTGLIRWDYPKLSRIQVLTQSGQLLLTVESITGQKELDVSYLPDGLYLIRLFDGPRAVVQKLIIQH